MSATTQPDGTRYYTHPATGEQLLSVTTVLGATEGKPYLVPWSAKLSAEHAVDHLDVIQKILATEGRNAAVKLLKGRAEDLRKLKADVGTYVHDVQEALILWAASEEGTGTDITLPVLPEKLHGALYDGEPIEDVAEWMVDGFVNFVTAFNPVFKAAEMTVYNRVLGVAGTLDMIQHLHGVRLAADGRLRAAPGQVLRLCVDTKTGRHLGCTVQEQVAAYRRMTEALMPMGQIEAMPATDAGAVLHLRPEHRDGYRLIPISLADDAKAWNRFRRAVELAAGRSALNGKPGRVARPPRPDGAVPAPWLDDLDGEGYGRVLGPLIKAGLDDLDEVAAFTAADLRGIRGIGPKSIDTIRRMLTDHDLRLTGESAATSMEVA